SQVDAIHDTTAGGERRAPRPAGSPSLRRIGRTAACDTMTNPLHDLHLIPALLEAMRDMGYTRPTPIQAEAIPVVMAGRDLIGCASTGTGKTAAFLLPILQRLHGGTARGKLRALVLSPTRELALQIDEQALALGYHVG